MADVQIVMGSALEVKRFDDGPVPLYAAQYAETYSSINEMGKMGVSSMKLLNQYFGGTPFPYYTLNMEFLKPVDTLHGYMWSMEHHNSFTGFADISSALKKSPDAQKTVHLQPEPHQMFEWVLHHMTHAYIPLRCYGKGYRPFNWETAPIIKTVWFNKGFAQFPTLHLLQADMLDNIRARIYNAPADIRNISLPELSELVSTGYSGDPEIVLQTLAKGILMANYLDNIYVRKATIKGLCKML